MDRLNFASSIVLVVASTFLVASTLIDYRADTKPVSQANSGSPQFQIDPKMQKTLENYANMVGLDSGWIQYCSAEMLRKAEHVADGSTRFGIQWNAIDNPPAENAVQTFENWKTHEITLCLAQAKGDLARAIEAGKQ